MPRTPEEKNTPAFKYWHQGFGRITRPGIGEFVPFLDPTTAERIALQASNNFGAMMRMVVTDDGLHGFQKEE